MDKRIEILKEGEIETINSYIIVDPDEKNLIHL